MVPKIMRILRIVLGWYFFCFSAWCLLAACWSILRASHSQDKVMLILCIVLAAFFSVVGTILAVAWWSNFREWASARGWAIAASLSILVISTGPPLFYLFAKGWGAFCQAESVFGIPTAIAVAALVVSSLPDGKPGRRVSQA